MNFSGDPAVSPAPSNQLAIAARQGRHIPADGALQMGFLNKMKTAFGGDDSELMASGVPGRGEILNGQMPGSAAQVGGAPPQQVCVFQVMVYLDGTPPFQAEVRKRVPVYALANLQPGQSVVAVRVNPSDHTRVGIDFSVEAPVVRLAKTPGRLTAAEVLENGDPC